MKLMMTGLPEEGRFSKDPIIFLVLDFEMHGCGIPKSMSPAFSLGSSVFTQKRMRDVSLLTVFYVAVIVVH